MKKLTLLFILIQCSLLMNAQVPQFINYQGVARDNAGNPRASSVISLRLSVLDGSVTGTTVYMETFNGIQTNQFGLFTVLIGNGTPVTGTFPGINWSVNTKWLRTEIDINGGTSYVVAGTAVQFVSAPYALYAKSAATGDNWGTQFVQTDGTLSGSGITGNSLRIAQQSATTDQVLKWNGTTWLPGTDNTGWGTQVVQTTTLLGGNGTTASPLTIASPSLNYRSLTTNGSGVVSWTVRGGYNVASSGLIANAATIPWDIFDFSTTQYGQNCTNCQVLVRFYSPINRTLHIRFPNDPNPDENVYDIAAGRSVIVAVGALNGQFQYYSNTGGQLKYQFIGFFQ